MGQEIERRFLVNADAWRQGAQGQVLKQGYVSVEPARTVRVRIAGDQAWLTLKGQQTALTRLEFEYPIPVADAEQMLASPMCPMVIEKVRYRIPAGQGLVWEVDEFDGANAGLVLAEIELPDEQTRFDCPPWLGAEVSYDSRYTNAYLSQNSFGGWSEAQRNLVLEDMKS